MDLLKFLLMLPVRIVQAVLYIAGMLLRPLIGNVSWSAPAWANATQTAIKQRPRQFAYGAIAAVALAAAGELGWHWYKNRPKPVEPTRISFSVRGPAATDYAADDGTPKVTVHPLDIVMSGSAAPIENVGKSVSKGITVSPALKGTWNWVEDRTLRFTPQADWPVASHVKVTFVNHTVFAPHVLMADDHVAFDIAPFRVTLGAGSFDQDPRNETGKSVVMPVGFNYPVDAAQLEKRITLQLIGRDGKPSPLRFSVTYDAAKMRAWVHSQPLALLRDDGVVKLIVDKGVRTSRGGDGTPDPLETSVQVPGLNSLSITNIAPTLVNNAQYEPEQVLLIEANNPIRGDDLNKLVKAWVLPARNPAEPQDDDAPPYEWNARDVSDAVLRQSKPVDLALLPTEGDYTPLQSFKYHADTGQRIFVRIAPGLRAFGGYQLPNAVTRTFTVPAFPKLLRFMAEGSLLSLSGSKQVSIVSRNLPGMKLEIGRVMPGQLQHLVAFNQGSYSHPDLSYAFNEDHIVERFVQTRVFPPAAPGKAHYEGIDLGQYLQSGKRGVFLLHLSGYDPLAEKKKADAAAKAQRDGSQQSADGNDNGDGNNSDGDGNADNDDSGDGDNSPVPTDTRMIVVTDLGMLVKRAIDGSQDVFVQSIQSGQPVAGAVVSVVAVNGQTLFSQTTTAEGVVHFPSFKGLDREKRPELYIVKKDDDLSFLPVGGQDRQLDFSRFDVGGDRNARSQGALSAYLFSDRGIYRPGDAFHIGLIVRAAAWSTSPAGIPLQAEVIDPRGMTVRRVPVSVEASGFTELTQTTSDTSPTGTWTVNLYIVKNGQAADDPIGSTTVQVKEFLPDRIKVAAKLSQQVGDGWVKPNTLKGLVDAQNLFGTPAANRRVEASLTLRPVWPTFRSWPDFHFFDVRRAKEGYTTALQDGKTDDQGHAEFDLDLKRYADATYQLYFQTKVYEAEGGRNVAANAQALVSNNDWLVGYKSVDDLSYIARGSPRTVKLMAVDPNAKSIALPNLRAQWIERRYVSVLTKQDSGVYKYVSRLKEVAIGEKPLTIAVGGSDYTLPTDKPGDYALVIRTADGTEVNRVEYAVAGAANVSRSLDRNAELQIHLSKSDYAPGEPVEISIRAPYAGSGLITIERDKVYAHAWFHADQNSSVQHITVPAGFEGNGYINVQYVRDPSSDEIFMSPLSYGVVPFSVNMDARRNALSVDAPALVKPGEVASLTVHSAHPSKVVVFAVDEGILQVARYKLGDPLQYFFRKRMLEVGTSQILDLILPDFKKLMAAAAPGGDADSAVGRQLNPFKRRRDEPAVYWSGVVDVNGDKTFSYKVPDSFNGKLRVMAVSVSPDLIGTYQGATTVRGDFVLSPNVPTTLAPGDEADISVGVANNIADGGSKPVPVAVTLQTNGALQVQGGATQTVSLASMHEGVVMFRVKATDLPGVAKLDFVARADGKRAGQHVEVSVRPSSAFRTQLDIARVKAGDTATVTSLRKMYDAYAARQASMSTLPVVLAQGLTAYLANYQNFCSEQMVSAAVPRLMAQKWPTVPALTDALQPVLSRGKATADPFAAFIDQLRTRQNAQGGFGVWSATPDADPFVSAYAMQVLLDARDRGLPVPADMIDAGNQYLKQLAANDSLDGLDLLRQRAYAVYLLTRQGNVTTNNLAAVQNRLQQAFPKQWQNDVAAAWLAASYQLLKQDKAAKQLIAGPLKQLTRTRDDGAFSYGYYNDPLTNDATVLYLLAKHFPDVAATLPPAALENIARPLAHNDFNTLSSAMTILALDAYASTNATALDQLKINEVHADGSSKDISSVQGGLWRAGTWDPAATTQLRFVNGSALPAWRLLSQSGYDRGAPTKAIKNGLEIIRRYTDTNGKALDKITVGEEIQVHVKIRATGSEGVGNVAISDLFPGGFDPVLNTPAATDPQDSSAATNDDGQGASGDDGTNGNGNADGGAAPHWASPIGDAGSTWQPDYADIREDRVVIYGTATPDVREFVYRIKASNAGHYVVPPAFGESMYDRRIQALAPGGDALTVVNP